MTAHGVAAVARALAVAASADDAVSMSLPREAYADPTVLALEREHLFGSDWVCIGRVEEIPEPGDCMPLAVGDEQLVAVRGDDRRVRVMSNVCRHRGALVVERPCSGTQLRCPYHHWAYDLTGRLVRAPRMDERQADLAGCALPEVATEEWMGFLFVSLAADPAPLAPRLAGLEALVGDYHLEQMRARFVVEEVWPANWKSFVENFMEGYHLTPLHRTTLHPVNPTRLCRHFPAGEAYFGYHAGFTPGLPRPHPGHPDLTPEQVDDCVMFSIPPGLVSGCAADYSSYVCVSPVSPGEVRLKLGLMFYGDTWRDDEIAEAARLFQETNAEDRAVLAGIAAGTRSRLHAAGPLSSPDMEGTVVDLQRYLARRLGPVLAAG